MTSLREAKIFRLKPLINNFHSKLSAISENDSHKQILCLVSEDNEILLRYVNELGSDALKLVSWFKKYGRVIHDVCFDPSGTWLLVLCFDNTLHIVPALRIVDTSQIILNTFSTTDVTSFVIPFVGPHECPNPKTCPNNDSTATTLSSSPLRLAEYTFDRIGHKDSNNEFNFPNRIAVPMTCDIVDIQNVPYAALETLGRASSTETSSSRNNSKQLKEMELGSLTNQTNSSNNESVESFMSSSTCPFPICTAWWQTLDKRNRAIIGYSDGSVCFVGLSPNCPFISNTSIENGAVMKLVICRDKNLENVTLLINSSSKEQWKLLLEQKMINYTFPGDASPNSSSQQSDCGRDDWQIVMPLKSNSIDLPLEDDVFQKPDEAKDNSSSNESPSHATISSQKPQDSETQDLITGVKSGILPAAKARLASLKDLGTKKFVALKMKLSDNKYKMDQDISDDSLKSFAIMESSAMTPEILTTPAGPYFIVQNLRNTFLLSALHTYSDTLSVHSMDISLIPLFLYKIPKSCQDVLICSNILYSVQLIEQQTKAKATLTVAHNEISPEGFNEQKLKENIVEKEEHEDTNEKKLTNVIGVISSAMASMKNGEEINFNEKALLDMFEFPDETVINIHRMGTFPPPDNSKLPKEESTDTLQIAEIRSPSSYVRLHKKLENNDFCSQRDVQIMANEFPRINYDPCIVVTNKHTYFIEFSNDPHAIFLNAAIAGMWNVCEEFCNTFDLSFAQCIEFAGDCLLRKKKVTQALLTYNVARIPPVRTALKLAMFGENYALMHLCAMALKTSYILKSRFPTNSSIKYLIKDHHKRHSEDITNTMLKKMQIDRTEVVNEGKQCSDFFYGVEESLQMSASSQFHLSNLLLITLTERAVKEKNYMPVWNFLITNSKFHTNMTSIVLCQSGLYSAALLLAMTRGACFDVFIGLISVANQEFGWYSEINVLLYNLSERIFTECITYLRHVSVDYFNTLQSKLAKIEEKVLERLEQQLNPFSAVYRPIVSQLSPKNSTSNDPNTKELFEFCKYLIETYLGIIMQLEALKMKQDNILNALTNFRINYEDNQFAIKSSNFLPISAGCSHCACVIDGCPYFWGSNGTACIYSVTKSSDNPDPPYMVKCLDFLYQLNLETHAVKCGRQHTLLLTNNGLYAFGSNQVGQLGIGKYMSAALQPMLVEALDGKNITILEAGQYHNAAVADGHLYTWGWGVYGQHGHGNVENFRIPTIVKFFDNKKVLQVSLGHAHSLVLCENTSGTTELYAFGSNHFGQLGTGQSLTTRDGKTCNMLKSLVPIKLEFSQSNIRLINTKFFANLAVNESNELFTWGASPQALRLANQNRKRLNAKQKIEESLKKEINRRIEMNNDEDLKDNFKKRTPSPPSTGIFIEVPVIENVRGRMQKSSSSVDLPINNNSRTSRNNLRRHSSPNNNEKVQDAIDNNGSWARKGLSCASAMTDLSIENKDIEMKILERSCSPEEIESVKIDDIERIEVVPPEILPIDVRVEANKVKLPEKKSNSVEEDNGEHLFPQKVDTSEVAGQILQLSSGLFHFAIISSTEVLYTWGKNFEHQLGHEDIRKSCPKPIELDSIENPLYVDCGADFTLVMTTDYIVKAFGGNSNGQCGRELTSFDKTKLPGKLFCLPTTKRLMRLDGQTIENPVEINLPRPNIRMDTELIRYLKNFPKFKPKYIVKSSLHSALEGNKRYSDGNLNEYCLESDDLASSIENISLNDDESFCSNRFRTRNFSSNDASPDEDHDIKGLRLNAQSISGDNINIIDYGGSGNSIFRQYIHYCLYIFHGLYDPIRVNDFAYNSLEFRIRTLMLNYKYVDAFTLCLTDCRNAQTAIKIFEYFTKDTSIVPMRRKDLKFFIYQLFIHFISKKFDLVECEKFFLSDLDYYLLELSYVMYFNNNNTELEQSLNRKFRELFIQDLSENQDYKLEDTDLIFDNLSVKFKAIVCKKLITVYEN